MPSIDIPDIYIPEIYVPDVPEIYSPHYITITASPEIDVPGCTYQHRDIKNTGNRNLLLEDPNGVFTTCDFPFPSFMPLDYSPENLVITEEAPVNNEEYKVLVRLEYKYQEYLSQVSPSSTSPIEIDQPSSPNLPVL